MHALTVRMPVMMEAMAQAFHGFYTQEDAKALLRQRDEGAFCQGVRRILDELGISYEKNGSVPYYKGLLEEALAALPRRSELTGQMLSWLQDHYIQHKSSQAYMTELVDRLAEPEDCAPAGSPVPDTTRVRILRRFLRKGIYGHGVGLGTEKNILELSKIPKERRMEAIQALDDGVFRELDLALQGDGELEKAEKEKRKERLSIERGDLGLLRLANDLAKGYFPAGDSVRRNLYYFAIAFDMYVYTGHKGELRDPDRDLEGNLFSGYYDNNLMAHMETDYEARIKSGGYEEEPTGLGINCKNGPEMILLYYLYTGLEPREKLKRANQMIKDLEKEQKKTVGEMALPATQYYRDSLVRVMGLTEADFKAYIRENYDFRRQNTYLSRYSAGTAQNTPARVYGELLQAARAAGLEEGKAEQGLWFCDSTYDMGKYSREGAQKPQPGFQRIVDRVHEQLRDGTVAGQPTRTSLMALYYQLYLVKNGQTEEADTSLAGFLERFLHGDGENGLNGWLERAGYLPWRSQNLWDVLVAFSAYAVVCLGE